MIHFNLRKDACTVAIVLATGIFLSVVPQRVWADGPSREEAPVTQRQAGTVTGKVVDAKSGEPIAGANVVVKGTQNGTSTDVNGKFTLEASSHATLVVSFIGYKNLEVPASAAKVVRLSEDAENLNEVVVVAYGTQKKSSVTGSIATVNADALNTVTASNVNNMLQGKVAGVQVLSTSGQPGQAAKIRIRGISSIGSSLDPLWVIDGVVAGTGASLNPNEIASITVLKDAAATALYGSRATNGVILVTTKTGNTNHSSLQVSVKAGIANQTFGRLKMMDSQQLYDYTASMQGLATSGIGTWFNESLLKHNTNWLKMATQTAPSQDYTISYTSGAAKKYRSFLMADYYDEEGTIKGYDFSRYSLRSNNDYIVNDHLTIKTKISGSYSHTFNQEADLYSSYTYLPWDYPYNEDGTVRTGKESNWFGRDASNFYHDLNKDWTREKTLGVTANLGFDYRFNDWLTFESNNSISFRKYLEEVYTDPTAIGAEAYNGSIENENIDYRTRYSNQLLRFNKTFNEKHTIGAFLGYEYSDYRSQDADVAGRGIPSGGQVFDVVTTPYSMKGTINEWAIQSYFANVNYTYDNKYMAQASYRMDGSSRFGSNNRYGSFYTIGGGWTFSQEKFLQDQSKWLTEG
ncbi:MAG: SusC/RagA family TonB-linked outer membrane protein, partial [Tannerella sp.]|nr:SusC/RagA family TonB-linked outer membrane protein [Tannerella sp.]